MTKFNIGDIVEGVPGNPGSYAFTKYGNGTGVVENINSNGFLEIIWTSRDGKKHSLTSVNPIYFRLVGLVETTPIVDRSKIIEVGDIVKRVKGGKNGNIVVGDCFIVDNIIANGRQIIDEDGTSHSIENLELDEKSEEYLEEKTQGEQKMDLKDVKKVNLVEAKKQIEMEKANAEILFAKQQLRNALDKIDEYDRSIKSYEESKKPYLEIIEKFK